MKKSITWKLPRFLRNKYAFGILAIVIFCLFSWTLIHFSKKVSTKVAVTLKTMPYAPKNEKTFDRDFKADLLFNNTPNQKPFTPLIIEQIKNAKDNIKLAMYSIDSVSLRDELYAAAKRGVKVEVVLSINKKAQHDNFFIDAPFSLRTYDVGEVGTTNRDLMHHKFVIFDDGLPTRTLMMGAFNWTDLQELYDPCFIMKTQDEDVVNDYSQEFERLKDGMAGKNKFEDSNYRPWQSKYTYNNGEVELWWSPGILSNTIKQRLLDKINSASSTIDVLVWQITDIDIVKAFVQKAKEGVKIRIITDDFNAWRDASKINELVSEGLKTDNLEIIDDAARTVDFAQEIIPFLSKKNAGFNSFLHHHVAIIDGKLLIAGTNNWSYSANYKNDESAFVTTIKDFVDKYQETFDYHYKKLHNKNLNVSFSNDVYTISDLNKFSGQKLVVLGEDAGGIAGPLYCERQTISSGEIKWELNYLCEDRILNFYVLGKNGEVLGNKLMGVATTTKAIGIIN